jgi:hypothetical protein
MLKSFSAQTNALGALNYKGTWDATANSPALASSVGTKGDYYVVSTAGSTTLNGISNWGIGDWAVFNGSVWQRVEGGADLNGVNLTATGTVNFTGATVSNGGSVTTVDIDGGTIDGTTIGGASRAAASVTTLDASSNVVLSTVGSYVRVQTGVVTFDISANPGGNDFMAIATNGTQRFVFNDLGAAYNTTGTWGTISDARLKENVIDATPKLNALMQLRVVNYNLKADPDIKQIGFIAQEVEKVFPGLVENGAPTEDGDFYKALKTSVLIPMLVKAMQEQQTQIESLKSEIQTLKGI